MDNLNTHSSGSLDGVTRHAELVDHLASIRPPNASGPINLMQEMVLSWNALTFRSRRQRRATLPLDVRRGRARHSGGAALAGRAPYAPLCNGAVAGISMPVRALTCSRNAAVIRICRAS